MAQPELVADRGVVATIGIMTSYDRTAIVIPMASENESLGDSDLCKSAGLAVENGLLAYILDCIATTAYVRYIQCEAMMNGKVPYRRGFGSTDFPGTRTADALPSNVAALALFYSFKEQDDPPTKRTRVGKTFLPGISATDVQGDVITSALVGLIQAFADTMVQGFSDGGNPASIWYRALSVPRPRPTDPQAQLGRIASQGVGPTVVTQRRRLLPQYT